MEEPPDKTPSKKRQEILDKAFAQLRKSRASMEPGLINKIRRIIAGNPSMMKALGVSETLEPEAVAPKREPAVMVAPKAVPQVRPMTAKPPEGNKGGKGYEKVDQAKNMEVMAKLMALNPAGREKIKSVIKKAVD